MGDTWVTDIRHYLDETGDFPELPTPALNIALHLASIIGWVTSRRVSDVERTNVFCRRSPNRERCPGEIQARFEENGQTIRWRCPLCGDNGYITGWEGSRWDRRRPLTPPAAHR